ncbi:hypothetical protein, partial [Escherichia coli]|uniref:hypothetical protein n=1 Tax=Escherichia coli TaxID=562 RepID=UPI001BAF117E
CNWAQFIYAIQLIDDDKGKRKDSISSLILKLKTLNQEANIEYLHEPTSKWMKKNLTFSLEQKRKN